MADLTLRPDGDDFVLEKTNPDGTKAQMQLSGVDIMTLAQSAKYWEQQARAVLPEAAGAIAATPAQQAWTDHDHHRSEVFLLVQAQEATIAYLLEPPAAARLARSLAATLEALQGPKTTRQ